MLVKNNSSKIVGINETSILPGATETIPEGYEKNPIVLKYIENGTFSVVEPAKPAKKEKVKKNPEGAKKADDPQNTGADPDAEGAQSQPAGA